MRRFWIQLRTLSRLSAGYLLSFAVSLTVLPAQVRAAPMLSIAATTAKAAEQGRATGTFALTFNGATTAPTSVNYTIAGSATNGVDYDRLSGTATIPAGQTRTTLVVRPIDDAARDPSETVVVTLVPSSAYALGSAKSATIEIADNDSPLPVLMVIANNDFYYTEYAAPRRELEAAGIPVVVGAGTRTLSTPHPNSGQGTDGGRVMPAIDLASARAADYSAIVFVGGWGAAQYQYAFQGTYNNAAYNGTQAIRAAANRLIGEFTSQNKPVSGICHGVTVLAWARVDGQSPLKSRRASTAAFNSPPNNVPQATTFQWHLATNGAAPIYVGGAYGDPNTATDDVVVDGRIITAENWDSAPLFGRTLANRLLGR